MRIIGVNHSFFTFRIIDLSFFRLSECIVFAILLRLACSHITARPFRALGQTEVDHVRVVVVGAGRGWFWDADHWADTVTFITIAHSSQTYVVRIEY